MLSEVIQWLNGDGDYQTGIRLYAQLGTDPVLRKLFKEPVITDFKKKRLREAMVSLLQKKEKAITVASATQQVYHNPASSWDNTTDAVLLELRAQWRPLYARKSNLQARLHDVADLGVTNPQKKIEACQMAAEILQLDQRIREIYAERSYYLEHGTLQSKAPVVEVIGPIEKVYARKVNLERYLRRLRRQLGGEKVSDHKRAKWVEQISIYEDELNALNKRLLNES